MTTYRRKIELNNTGGVDNVADATVLFMIEELIEERTLKAEYSESDHLTCYVTRTISGVIREGLEVAKAHFEYDWVMPLPEEYSDGATACYLLGSPLLDITAETQELLVMAISKIEEILEEHRPEMKIEDSRRDNYS